MVSAPAPPDTASTSKRTYAWTRFWAPLGDTFASFDGFLPDPLDEFGVHLNPRARAWAQIADRPCLVLLGEPGMGKSTEVRRAAHARESEGRAKYVDLALYESEDRLLREVFEDGAVANWVADGAPFELFFDALDESLFRVSTFAKNLVERLRKLPRDRLRVRIACRTADWPNTLATALRDLYSGGDAFSIWELLPLRRTDFIEAARASGFEAPEDFVREVAVRELQPLAIKPLTLEMLLRTSTGGALPGSRGDLFERATLLLATEPNDVYPRAAQSLSAAQRLAVAQRIAAATMLCGKNVIARDGSTADRGELVLEQIAGGTEPVGESVIDIDPTALAETVRTGLFSGAGPGRLGWYHHAIAEFLAGRWLARVSLDPRQVDSLLFHAEDPRRVVPQLRAVASWVAAYDSRVLAKLAESEPSLLLSADTRLDEPSRARLVEELLRRIDAVEAHDFDYKIRNRYATLKHSGLASQVAPYIGDRTKNAMVRRVAINLAEECGLIELENLLVEITLDATEAYGTRQQAAAAVGKIGSPTARRRLRVLVTELVPGDVDDELRGYALDALWPEYVTRPELFAALRTPRGAPYSGAYARFVCSLADRLRDEDMAEALNWAASHIGESHLPSEEKVIGELVERALPLLSDPRVAGAYTRFVASSIRGHHSRRPTGWAGLVADTAAPNVRRALLLDVLSLLGPDWIPSQDHVLGPGDFTWIIGQLDSTVDPPGRQVIIDVAVRAMQFGLGVEDLDTVLTAALRHVDLAQRIDGFTRAIDIDSEAAAALRKYLADMAELMKRPERPRLEPPPAERVRRVLEQIEGGQTTAFWLLGQELTLGPDSMYYEGWKTRITSFPGWNAADEKTRSRVVAAAKLYLADGDPEPSEWFCKSRIYYPAVGGYRALRLLLDVEPQALDALPPETWAKWAPIIVTSHVLDNERDPTEIDLLKRAYGLSPGAVLEVVVATMRDDDRRYKALNRLLSVEQIWDARVARRLTSMIAVGAALRAESTAQILTLLLRRKARGAVALAQSLILGARILARVTPSRIGRLEPTRARPELRPSTGRPLTRARERFQRLLSAFLSEAPASAWPIMRRLMKDDLPFCRTFFLGFADRADHDGRAVSRSLAEDAVAELYLWLRRAFPPDEDPVFRTAHAVGQRESVGHLRNGIFDSLTHRKTFEARDAIRGLARATGDRSLLVHAIDVEGLALAEAWAPPAPGLLVRLLREREARVVTSGAQLLDVVVDSLRRLQDRLQGEIAEVPFLWDGGGKGLLRPKDEESLSSFVAAHLDRDLRERGIIINREVQIRRRRGERPGEDTDIHVDALTASRGGVDRLRLIVESKGNWNPKLETDLEDQLVNRYLAQNDASSGIYLVGWYASENWDPSDSRRAAAERRDLSVVTRGLADKAKALCQGGTRIDVFVLDTRM